MAGFDEALRHFQALVDDQEASLSTKRSKVVVFLLGPSKPPQELERRRELKRQLERKGPRAIIMEDLPDWPVLLTPKFLAMIESFKPDLYIAIFTRLGSPLGTTFEIGFLTGLLGFESIRDKLRYCLESGAHPDDVMSHYVQEQLPMTACAPFHSDSALLRGVLNHIDNYGMERSELAGPGPKPPDASSRP